MNLYEALVPVCQLTSYDAVVLSGKRQTNFQRMSDERKKAVEEEGREKALEKAS